jgi:hypothetical protein
MKYKSYKKDVLKKMKQASNVALEATGLEAQRDITNKITANTQVDTGRMRASITYITGDKKGDIKTDNYGIKHNEDKPFGKLPDDTLHIGTNVKYAMYQEKFKPFLKPSIINNFRKYSKMMNEIFAKVMRS